MKKDNKEIYKSVKSYNMIMSNIWQLITILVLGILLGYLLEKNATTEDIDFMLISVVGSIIIGVPVFFIGLIKSIKKLDDKDKPKKDNNEDSQYLD